MRLKTILKEIDKILTLWQGDMESKEKALRELAKLRNRIYIKVKEEEEKKGHGDKLRHLMGWYLRLWDEKPPERLRFMNPEKIIGKHLKELIAIYEKNKEDIEDLKRDYEEFKKTWKSGDKGIMHFRSVLPQLKASKSSQEWGETRGRNYYNKLFDEDDELPWED